MKKIITLAALLFCMTAVIAQQVPEITMGTGQNTITGCDYKIYDNGGLDGSYAPNSTNTLTIYSDDPSNNAVKVNIMMLDFNIHCSDTLFIYDGIDDTAPLLDALNDSTVSQVSAQVMAYAATIANASGAITLKFVSDGQDKGTGYVLGIECVAPCQRVNIFIDTLLSSHVPHFEEDGFAYIDFCPGDILHLVAYCEYPDNNYSYSQSDATTTFNWDMNFEVLEGVGMTAIDYEFATGRGYDIAVTATDEHGCPSYIPQVFRVRTSQNPIRSVAEMPEICTGQSVEFTTGYDYLSSVQIDSVGSEQITSLSVSDTIFLPDGHDCGAGCAYVSPVTFTSFSPSATITSPDDILYVRLSIEHSYVGDIWIGLECPNGQQVTLMKKYGSAGYAECSSAIPQGEYGWLTSGSSYSFFGDYYEPDGSYCDAAGSPMGTCWNYCWSNATNQGYQYNPGQYVYSNQNHINGNYLDSTNVAAKTNMFKPDGNFSNLIGCPLNGIWSIKVVDGWGSDNGYICGWEIALDPSLLPQDWSYNVEVDTTWLEGPGAQGEYVIPDTSGNINYTIHVQDEFGCVYDTTALLKVTPAPQPNLGEDFFICQDDEVTLNADMNTPNTTYAWNTGDKTPEILVLSEGDYSVKVSTSNDSGTLTCIGSDTIHVGVHPMPVFDYEVSEDEGCAPLVLRFTNNSTPEDGEYQWYLLYEGDEDATNTGNAAFSSTLRSPSFKIEEPGNYSLFLSCVTPDGCTDTLLEWTRFKVYAQPIAEFEADPEISMMSENDGEVHFISYMDTTIVDSTLNFHWDFADGETDSASVSPTHTFASWGDYDVTLTVETGQGCRSEITHTVVIEQDLIFPNVITPNGDNVNDVFAIDNLNTNINEEDPDEYRTNDLYIYDRWGRKVYEAHNYDTYVKDGEILRGDQVFDAEGLPDGVYYFSFYYKGKAKTINYNGSLTIVR